MAGTCSQEGHREEITQDKAPNQFNNTSLHNKFSTNLYTIVHVIPCSRKSSGPVKQGVSESSIRARRCNPTPAAVDNPPRTRDLPPNPRVHCPPPRTYCVTIVTPAPPPALEDSLGHLSPQVYSAKDAEGEFFLSLQRICNGKGPVWVLAYEPRTGASSFGRRPFPPGFRHCMCTAHYACPHISPRWRTGTSTQWNHCPPSPPRVQRIIMSQKNTVPTGSVHWTQCSVRATIL